MEISKRQLDTIDNALRLVQNYRSKIDADETSMDRQVKLSRGIIVGIKATQPTPMTMEEWELEKIDNALRLVQNYSFTSTTIETCTTREVQRAREIIKRLKSFER